MSRKALIIGVANYDNRRLRPLPSAGADVDAMATVLRTRGNFEVETLKDPNRFDMFMAIGRLFAHDHTTTTALLYYAGHGYDDLHDQLYLTPTDTDPDQLGATAISAMEIQQTIKRCPTRQKLIFLDCCFAAMFADGARSHARKVNVSKFTPEGTLLWAAAGRTGEAFEDPTRPDQPAQFTKAVASGLSGRADATGNGGWITAEDLNTYLHGYTFNRGQEPEHIGRANGDILLTRHPNAESEDVPDEPVSVAEFFASKEPTQPADDPLDDRAWRQLIDYYVGCLRYEAALENFVDPKDRNACRLWPGGRERIILNSGDKVVLPDTILTFAEKQDPDVPLIYGYPLIGFYDRRKYKVAPLLVASVQVEDDDKAQIETIDLNHSLLETFRDLPFDPADLGRIFSDAYRVGDPARLAEAISKIVNIMDLSPVDDIDPENMCRSVGVGPTPDRRHLHNAAMVLAPRSDGALGGVIKDFTDLKEKHTSSIPRTALAGLSGDPMGDAADTRYTLVTPLPIDEAQERVIHSAMTRRLTVVTGPPGTGKTATIAALASTAMDSGQTVLIGSLNNKAVDSVMHKTDGIGKGLVLRTGNQKVQQEEPERLLEILDTAEPPQRDLETLRAIPRHANEQIVEHRQRIDDYRAMEMRLAALKFDLHHHRDTVRANAALTTFVDDPAPNRDRHARMLKRVRGRWPIGLIGRWLLRRRFGLPSGTDIARLVYVLELIIQAHDLQRRLDETDIGLLWSELKDLMGTRLDGSAKLTTAALNSRINKAETAINHRIDVLMDPAASSWGGIRGLLPHLSNWATTGLSARAFPADPGLFDIVVIDEASQCSPAKVMGLLMRGKRAVIIGDPHQLPPVVKLTAEQDATVRRRAKIGKEWMETRHLGTADNSIFHAAEATEATVHLLDQHYRCDPEIIAEPNTMMYGGRLTVLTDPDALAAPVLDRDEDAAVHVTNVSGVLEYPTSGSCVNHAEVDEVIVQLRELHERFPTATLGVVTPFRAQSDEIERRLRAHPDLKVLVGTAHTFQGAERDIIVLSAVASTDIAKGTARWLLRQNNLWNVAVTRARSRLHIVADEAWWSGKSGLLSRVIASADGERAASPARLAVDAVQARLVPNGITDFERDVVIGSQRCDLRVVIDGRPTAVIVDTGRPESGHAFRQLLARIDMIEKTGHRVIRVPEWRARYEPETVIAELGC